MSKLLKSMMVDEYRRELDGVQSCVLVDVSPLTVGEVEDFRRHLRQNEVRLRVVRNRLAFHALEGSPIESVRSLFAGPVAIAFDRHDPEGVATVKAIRRFLDERKKLKAEIRGGFSEGEVLDSPAMDDLAKMPDRPQLRAIVLGTIQGPARGLASAMANVAGGLARALKARIDQDAPEGGREGGDAEGGADGDAS